MVSWPLDKFYIVRVISDFNLQFLVDLYNNKTNKKLAFLQSATFQVGAGGFNGPRTNSGEIKAQPVPQRAPDHVAEEPTSPDQVNLCLK
jgi:hypothetical protein